MVVKSATKKRLMDDGWPEMMAHTIADDRKYEDIQKLSQKVAYLITVVDFLDRTLRVVVNRTYTIKNAIEWRRFTSGAV